MVNRANVLDNIALSVRMNTHRMLAQNSTLGRRRNSAKRSEEGLLPACSLAKEIHKEAAQASVYKVPYQRVGVTLEILATSGWTLLNKRRSRCILYLVRMHVSSRAGP